MTKIKKMFEGLSAGIFLGFLIPFAVVYMIVNQKPNKPLYLSKNIFFLGCVMATLFSLVFVFLAAALFGFKWIFSFPVGWFLFWGTSGVIYCLFVEELYDNIVGENCQTDDEEHDRDSDT